MRGFLVAVVVLWTCSFFLGLSASETSLSLEKPNSSTQVYSIKEVLLRIALFFIAAFTSYLAYRKRNSSYFAEVIKKYGGKFEKYIQRDKKEESERDSKSKGVLASKFMEFYHKRQRVTEDLVALMVKKPVTPCDSMDVIKTTLTHILKHYNLLNQFQGDVSSYETQVSLYEEFKFLMEPLIRTLSAQVRHANLDPDRRYEVISIIATLRYYLRFPTDHDRALDAAEYIIRVGNRFPSGFEWEFYELVIFALRIYPLFFKSDNSETDLEKLAMFGYYFEYVGLQFKNNAPPMEDDESPIHPKWYRGIQNRLPAPNIVSPTLDS